MVQHHLHTNDVHLDPDMAGSVYVRLNPLQPLMKFHIVQHLYFFVLLGFYGFLVVWQSFSERSCCVCCSHMEMLILSFLDTVNVVNGSHFTPMSPLLRPHRVFETFTSLLFFARWVVLPVYQTGGLLKNNCEACLPDNQICLLLGSPWVLVPLAMQYVVAGYYLAFFFSISHNFSGVHMLDDTTRADASQKRSFLYKQVSKRAVIIKLMK